MIVADLAVRVSAADWHRVRISGWGGVAVLLAVIILSWVGYHNNRRALGDRLERFWSKRFAQYAVEIVILGVYFAMGLRLDLPDRNHPSHLDGTPSAFWTTACLVAVFALYFVWDLFDVSIAKARDDTAWAAKARRGRLVTLAFWAALTLVLAAATVLRPRTSAWVAAVDTILVALLYVYRVKQEIEREKAAPN